ncbi:hypothetical protein AFEL58S_01990 [Afipia felis]
MPAVTFLSDCEAKRFETIDGDKECNELLRAMNLLSGRRWLIEVRSRFVSRGWFRHAAKIVTYTLYLDCNGEYQVMNLVTPSGGSVFSRSGREDVMNFMLGYLGGMEESAQKDTEIAALSADLEKVQCELDTANQMVGEVEQRFPNWQSFRDLIDCIDVTLHQLRHNHTAPASAAPARDDALREALEAIAHAESMLSAHIEEYHDGDFEPHEEPAERASLRDIQHHLAGALIGEDGEPLLALAASATKSDGSAEGRARADAHGLVDDSLRGGHDRSNDRGGAGIKPGPSDPTMYVVRKGGYFYRPGAKGYTSSIYEAGLWSKDEAEAYAVGVQGVTVHPSREFLPASSEASIRAGRAE